MVIGIDIRVLDNPIKSGVEEYTENLLPHLIREGKDVQFKLFYSSRRNSLPNYDWLKESNVKLYKFNYPNNLLFTSSGILKRPCVDRLVGGADVFFFPHFFLSALSPRCKRVTTFHDLSYVHFPEFITLRKRIWHNLQMCPEWQARYSDKIISVSESTKKDLTNFYKIDPARIEVIYSGISDCSGDPVSTRDFKKAINLPSRFILFLGKVEPRKNTINIVRAFNNLKSNQKYKDVGLVIAGARGWLCGDTYEEASSSKHRSQIIFTGQLTDQEKMNYYQAADVFVYPSFFEGFGFPPIEAMKYQTPVITSRNSSLPEVVGDSAIMIDPYDTVELELWITKLLDDDKFSGMMRKRGIDQTAKFSWHDAASRTLNVLNRA